jgi:hypothetical protein
MAAEKIRLHNQIMQGFPQSVKEILGRENLTAADIPEIPRWEGDAVWLELVIYIGLMRLTMEKLYTRSGTSLYGWVSGAWEYIKIAENQRTPRKTTHQRVLYAHGEKSNFRVTWATTKGNKSPVIFLFTERTRSTNGISRA